MLIILQGKDSRGLPKGTFKYNGTRKTATNGPEKFGRINGVAVLTGWSNLII